MIASDCTTSVHPLGTKTHAPDPENMLLSFDGCAKILVYTAYIKYTNA